MSILIKALDKAENGKVEHANTKQKQAEQSKTKDEAKTEPSSELALSPTGSVLAEPVPLAKASDANTQSTIQAAIQTTSQSSKTITAPLVTSTAINLPKSAANVFSAKGIKATNQNTRLALIGGAGLVALLGMVLYFYQFIDNMPDVVIPPRSLAQLTTAQPSASSAALSEMTAAEAPMPQAIESDETAQLLEQQAAPIKKMAVDNVGEIDESSGVTTELQKRTGKSLELQFGEAIASPSAAIRVTKTRPEAGVNPILMSAYEAYNAGNDTAAQQLYKQVLQRDVRNVDALLGLGAIALRQGRVADANGWFDKVLEIEPRNSLAQSALLDNQLQTNQSPGNAQDAEGRLKNMLSKHPEDANLHVALGNYYADQNQWPAAQQAYFDAYSLNGRADNAFNLAVSLDQMGKPKLALPYYQRALAQASDKSSIDKAALEARIAAIQ